MRDKEDNMAEWAASVMKVASVWVGENARAIRVHHSRVERPAMIELRAIPDRDEWTCTALDRDDVILHRTEEVSTEELKAWVTAATTPTQCQVCQSPATITVSYKVVGVKNAERCTVHLCEEHAEEHKT